MEENEYRFDWFHSRTGAARRDIETAEVAHSFGLLTLEIQAAYERDRSPEGVLEGTSTIDVSARYPLFEYVAPNGFFDTTFGAALDLGIPANSPFSKNTEFAPRIFNELRLGTRVTLQSTCGYSTLFGPGENSGLHVMPCTVSYWPAHFMKRNFGCRASSSSLPCSNSPAKSN